MAVVSLPVSLEDPLLTRKEVRYRLRGMSRTTLWRREKRRGLKFNVEGLIRQSQLEAWLEGREPDGQS